MNGELEELQRWYLSQCDGDWEHTYGVSIGTLDNPGWHVEIDLAETGLENRIFPAAADLASEQDWIDCKVVEAQFRGAGGPAMLGRILRMFLDWSREAPVQSNAHAG
ncbi:MAG TPA: immunity 53 family protein [Gemmatimonadaceae bacterium]|nr:immunity 53 family protein [Gemmatimonadaceae bacterium]